MIEDADDATAVVGRLLAAVRSSLDVDAAVVLEFGHVAHVRAAIGAAASFGVGLGSSQALSASAAVASTEGRLPAVVVDAERDRVAHRLLSGGPRLARGFAAVPLHLPGGHLYGALGVFHSDRLDDVSGTAQMFLRAIGRAISPEISVARQRTAQRRQERADVLSLMEPGRLRAVLQPIVRLADGQTTGVEALARFDIEPYRPPDVWFANAARQGVGPDLEGIAMTRALSVAPELPAPWYLSINASPDFVRTGLIGDLLADADLERTVIEITEHVAVHDYAALTRALAPLRRRGCRVAVDDAGAGFASLRHVVRLQPDIIKLDASVTRGCDADHRAEALVEAMVEFAGRVDAVTVAEAVETPDEFCALQGLGVDFGQGYLFAAPGELADLRASYPIVLPDAQAAATHDPGRPRRVVR